MAQVMIPQQKGEEPKRKKGILPDNFGKTAGAAVAAYYSAGDPGAIVAGATLGDMAQNVIDPARYTSGKAQSQVPSVESNGMTRRTQAIQSDPLTAIQEAKVALADLPPHILPETRKTFEDAFAMAKKNQELA